MKKFFLIFCALLLVTVCAVSVGVYVYWDTNRQKQFLENTATSLLHRQVHIRGAHLRLLPQTHMVLEQVTIKDQDGNADAVSIDQVRVSLSLRHLLTGLVYVRSLTIDRPRTTLVLSPDRLSVSALIHAFISERSDREAGQEGRFDNFQIFLETVRIQNGAIILKKPPPFSNTIVSKVVEFDLTTGQISTAKPTSVTFTCRLQENGNVGTIRIQGKLGPLAKESLLQRPLQCDGLLEAKDIAVSSLLPYLPEAWKIESLHGVVDGRVLFQGYLESDLDISADIDVENLAVKDSRLFKNGITAKKARLISSIKRIDKKIIIPRITVVLPELTAEGTFLLDYTDTAIIRTEWKTESFNYRDVLRYLPWSRWSPQASHLMKEKIVAGIVDTVSFSYHQSGVHSDKVIAAEGRVCFRDFSLTIADDLPPLESLGGELRLKEGELIVTTATGKFGSTEIKQCSISLSPSDFLDISAACNLDLSDLHKLLRSHIMPVSVHRRVEKLTSMSGNGRLSLDFSCPLKELSELTVGGKLQLENAAIDYKLFRGKATNLFGTIQFTPYLITFTDIQGYWLNSPVTCNGTIENYRTRQSEIKVQVTSKRALTDDLASTFFPWEGAYGTGLLPIEINFFCRGYRKETFYFEGVTIPTDISLFFPAFPHPFTQVAGTVRFSSTGLRFSDMSCKTGDSELTFFGTWQNLRQPIITGTIEGTVINFLDFIQPPKAGGKPPPPFTLDAIEINIKEGRIKDLTASDLETNLQYRNGVFFIPFLTAKKATYRHLMTFTNITTLKEQEPVPISYENGVAAIPFIHLDSCGGYVEGTNVRLPLLVARDEKFALTASIDDIILKDCLGDSRSPEQQRITGILNVNGNISGMGRNVSEWMRSLEGNVTFAIRHGVLKKAKILSRVFSLLNVSRLFSQDYTKILSQGMYFESILGDFQILNGIATAESIFLDSPAMKIETVGDINLGTKALDLEMAVQPLETVDKVVEKIPIIGTVLMGEEGALIVSYYKVSGTLENPELNPIVLQSIGRKGKGIFRRIFTFPKNMITQ